MAELQPCPSCERQVSTMAEACPGCGHPLKEEKPKERKGHIGIAVFGLAMFAFGLFLVVGGSNYRYHPESGEALLAGSTLLVLGGVLAYAGIFATRRIAMRIFLMTVGVVFLGGIIGAIFGSSRPESKTRRELPGIFRER